MKKKFIYFSLILLLITTITLAIPAFPEATGFGQNSTGGRSPSSTVYVVNTVEDLANADTDPNITTIREALEASGPRFVVFDVGGKFEIDNTPIEITNSNITIAGQTAPYPGVTLTLGHLDTDTFPPIRIKASDVIIRNIKIRPGRGPYNASNLLQSDNEMDAISIAATEAPYPEDIIIDHCSFSWAADEIFGIGSPQPGGNREWTSHTRNITIQWSFLYQGISLQKADKDGKYGLHALGIFTNPFNCSNISISNNLMAHLSDRAPRIMAFGGTASDYWVPGVTGFTGAAPLKGGSAYDVRSLIPSSFPDTGKGEVINNLIFNAGEGTRFGTFNWQYASKQYIDIIGNCYVDPAFSDLYSTCDAVSDSHSNGLHKAVFLWIKDHSTTTKEARCMREMVPYEKSSSFKVEFDYIKGSNGEDSVVQFTFPNNPYSLYLDGNHGVHFKNKQSDMVREDLTQDAFYATKRNNEDRDINLITSWQLAKTQVLLYGGAAYPRRDPADLRVIDEVNQRKDEILQHIVYGSSNRIDNLMPVLTEVRRDGSWDSDGDGMPDHWENNNGLDKDDPADALGDTDNDGYLNIEEYINGLMSPLYPYPYNASLPIVKSLH